ncbi:MAG TPA: hypothetical protein IGS53_11260 [Leptolyngbyaceae cyanobacterium M33_DOE_097]|nr:hypothetical protein [Leptolyngbyaceae cyanobacterium M33_DOE_097]
MISSTECEQLKDRQGKDEGERHAQHKHELQSRHSVPITPELKIKDDAGSILGCGL